MTDANNNKNTPEQIVIGVDGGTTAVKAVAFDLQGHVHAVQHRSVPVVYGSSGQAEQDMDAIWLAVAACLKDVHDALPSAKIVGIGLTGQGDGAGSLMKMGILCGWLPRGWMDVHQRVLTNGCQMAVQIES